MREHLDEGKWWEVGRGYGDGMYEGLQHGVCQENVAEIGHPFLAAERHMLGDDEGEAVGVELATGEGKAEEQVEGVGAVFHDPLYNLPG